jgi:hypothetical protein
LGAVPEETGRGVRVVRTSAFEVRGSSFFKMVIDGHGPIRGRGSEGMFTLSIVSPPRRSCSAELMPQYVFALDHRQASPLEQPYRDEEESVGKRRATRSRHCPAVLDSRPDPIGPISLAVKCAVTQSHLSSCS